jgi:predicted esterase
MKINNIQLDYEGQKINGFTFIPENTIIKTMAVITHGYTSHKGSLLNWCIRLCESGVRCVLFDLPGHYIGTFSEVDNFDSFKKGAPELFVKAYNKLQVDIPDSDLNSWKLVLGGHSLGALLSLKASTYPELNQQKSQHVLCVGFGLPPKGVTHVFDTPFYKSTLNIRGQLVSPKISPDVMFPWIKEEKEKLSLENKNIILLTGEDDVVVGKDGIELLANSLTEQGNNVQIEKPLKLPHHLPENAAPHIKKILRDLGLLT